jgi:predicted nucleotidyltransferase
MTFDVATCRAHLRTRQERQHQAREQQRRAVLQALCAAVRSIFPRFPSVQRAYLFGTVLRPGALRSTSDIDIAVEGRLNAEDYFALWRELERAVGGWPIDLVELDRGVHFADRVRELGMLIYERPDSISESRHYS